MLWYQGPGFPRTVSVFSKGFPTRRWAAEAYPEEAGSCSPTVRPREDSGGWAAKLCRCSSWKTAFHANDLRRKHLESSRILSCRSRCQILVGNHQSFDSTHIIWTNYKCINYKHIYSNIDVIQGNYKRKLNISACSWRHITLGRGKHLVSFQRTICFLLRGARRQARIYTLLPYLVVGKYSPPPSHILPLTCLEFNSFSTLISNYWKKKLGYATLANVFSRNISCSCAHSGSDNKPGLTADLSRVFLLILRAEKKSWLTIK